MKALRHGKIQELETQLGEEEVPPLSASHPPPHHSPSQRPNPRRAVALYCCLTLRLTHRSRLLLNTHAHAHTHTHTLSHSRILPRYHKRICILTHAPSTPTPRSAPTRPPKCGHCATQVLSLHHPSAVTAPPKCGHCFTQVRSLHHPITHPTLQLTPHPSLRPTAEIGGAAGESRRVDQASQVASARDDTGRACHILPATSSTHTLNPRSTSQMASYSPTSWRSRAVSAWPIARHVMQSIWYPRVLSQIASVDGACNICQANCPPRISKHLAFGTSFLSSNSIRRRGEQYLPGPGC